MSLRTQLLQYEPYNEQEAADRTVLLRALEQFDNCASRDNLFGHLTASAWIVNPDRSRVLLVWHRIYDAWSWTGGHADGETDLLAVACREAMEETGLPCVTPVSDAPFSLELLGVQSHRRRGVFVPAHTHWNLTYLLEADDTAPLTGCPDENRAVAWFSLDRAPEVSNEPWMRPIYAKLNEKLRAIDRDKLR